jgi:WD40 repeat protein/serine/threonine protein kinase
LGLAVFGFDETATGVPTSEGAPALSAVGPYRILRLVGEGGMGLVYLAEQTQPIRRDVALKVIKPGIGSSQVLARFESERQALAMLHHPGIAAIFDAGTTPDGRPYFAMEYVSGASITTYCDDRRLEVADRLELFLQVCAAVQHAHQKGIIHRDLKPSNILVTVRDDLPVVKVIDFGVAKATAFKLTDRTLHTQLGLVLGTPEYMSPEQAGATRFDVDTRTDIYSLGVVLYELLAGIKPFERQDLHAAAALEMLRILREVEAPRLTTRISSLGDAATEIARRRQTDARTLTRQLHGDLEWITLRTLEKDPSRRYGSVSELAGDVRRHLQDEPLTIGPPSLTSRALKFAKRHRTLSLVAAALVASMLVTSVVSILFWIRAERARRETNRQLISALVARGMGLVDAADPLRGLVYLTHALRLEQDPERQRVHRVRIAAVRDRTPRLVRVWNHGASLGRLGGFDATPDGLIATGGMDGLARLWSVQQSEAIRTMRHGAGISAVDLTEDGKLLLTAGEDDVAWIWQTASGQHSGQPLRHRQMLTATFSPDARFVATGSADGTVRVWDVSTSASLCEASHKGAISRVRFAPDSKHFVMVSADSSIGVWTLPGCVPSFPPLRHDTSFASRDAAFSPDGRWIVTAAPDRTARLWDAMSGKPVMPPLVATDNVLSAEFNRDGTLLVTTTVDRMTTVWRVADRTVVFTRPGSSVPRHPDVSPQGMVAVGSDGGDVDVWTSEGKRVALLPHSSASNVSFLSSGRFLVTAANDGLVRVWDLAPSLPRPPAVQLNEGEGAFKLAFSPAGRALAVLSLSSVVRVFDVASGVPEASSPARLVTDFDFSPDGRHLAIATRQRLIRVWDVGTGEPRSPVVEHPGVQRLKFSPRGDTVASGGVPGVGGGFKVWDATTGQLRFDRTQPGARVSAIEFTRDGLRLMVATTSRERNLTIWNATTGALEATDSHGNSNGTEFAKINHQGSEVWSAGDDRQVRVWAPSGRAVSPAPPLLLSGGPAVLQLSPNDRKVAVGTSGGEIRVIDIRTSAVNASPMRHASLVYTVAFSPDSSVLLTSGGDGMARAWDVGTGEPLTAWLTTGVQFPRYAAVSPDGKLWSYVGEGAFVERFGTEGDLVDRLVRRAEAESGHTLTASTIHTPLSASDVEARWRASPTVDTLDESRRESWLVWLARFEWLRAHMRESLNALEELRTIRPLRWPEVMQQVGAFASVRQWNNALRELQGHRAWYGGSPEFLFFEAVARRHLGDRGMAATICRQQLSAHGETENAEQVSWIVRVCLLAGPDAGLDWEAVGRLAQRAPEIWRHGITRELLTSAVLVRQGQFERAIQPLRNLPASERGAPPLARMFLALAEAGAGDRSSARSILEHAREYEPSAAGSRSMNPLLDAVRQAEAVSWYRPWFAAEAEVVRAEVVAALEGQKHLRRRAGRDGAR